MIVTQTQLTPIVAIVAGILILIIPRLLNYIIALYLIYIGFVQLNATHHWIRFGMVTRLRPAIVLVHNKASPKPIIHVMASPAPQSMIHDRMNQDPMIETV
jgi:energy-converting hydrogenase Eha subunit C